MSSDEDPVKVTDAVAGDAGPATAEEQTAGSAPEVAVASAEAPEPAQVHRQVAAAAPGHVEEPASAEPALDGAVPAPEAEAAPADPGPREQEAAEPDPEQRASSAGSVAGDEVVGDEVVGDEVAGDEVAGDEVAGDEVAGSTSEHAPSGGEGAEGEDGERKRKRRRRRRRRNGASDAAPGSQELEGAVSVPEPRRSKPSAKLERSAFSVGDQVYGKITMLTDDAIIVDIAGKAVGFYDRSALSGDPPAAGEQFISKVQSASARSGALILGDEAFDLTESREHLRQALDSGASVHAWVTGVIKGGVEVDYRGVRAFGPASQVELRHNADLQALVGQRLEFEVTQYGKKGRDVVVSRKKMLEAEAGGVRREQLAKIEPDAIVRAVVRNVLAWGVFAALPDFGDIEGVIHMSEASHDRSAKLTRLFKVNQEIPVKVLRVDDKGKLWLSHKATQSDPWAGAAERYPAGARLTGEVVRLTDFGAFVRLEAGIDGLCHVSDLSFEPIEHPKDVVRQGQELQVIVANVDEKAHKITLHPAPPEGEEDTPRVRVAPQKTVSVVVVQAKEPGLSVRIVGATGRAARGFIPAGQTGTARGTDLRKTFPVGTRFDAKVVEVDPRRGEARLSIRALKDDAEKQAYRDYRKQVQREASFGTFADLLKKT